MSTVENEMYGGNWQQCAKCGVKDRPIQLVRTTPPDAKVHLFRHIDARAEKCAEWKATLGRAQPADLQAAAAQLLTHVHPTADELLAEVNAPKPTAPELRRQKREQAELKDWASKPWVNPHDKGGK